MRDVCDVAYVLIVDELRAVVLADRQSAFAAVIAGAEGVDIPDWATERAKFDEALAAPPAVEPDDEHAALRRALGLPERTRH